MASIEIQLSDAVPTALRADVEDKLAYVTEHLVRHSLSPDGRRVTLELRGEPIAGLTDAVVALVKSMTRGHRPMPTEAIWSHPVAFPAGDPWSSLAGSGLVFEEGVGQVALRGEAALVAEALQRRFSALASEFGAELHRYSTLLSTEALDRCQYFSSFPHHVTFAPHVREDLEVIAGIARAPVLDWRPQLAAPTHVLSPAVCFHTYAGYVGARFEGPQTVTATGKCFRFESKNLTRLERSWDFTMQEIVFLGDQAWVDGRREQSMTKVRALIEALGLSASITPANDPFFLNNFAAKRYHQLLTNAKFELRLDLGNGRSLAAASFNIHADFFGTSYDIQCAGRPIHTGCTAFGIERWVWALYTQLGPSLHAWPRRTRELLGLP